MQKIDADPTAGLRVRKKLAMRRLIADVAMRLFSERGFEEVTVSDVAAAANVSQKTVFNYFTKKEDLVLASREEIEAEMVRSVRDRAPGESVLEVVRRHTLSVAEHMNALPAAQRVAFRKVLRASPSVHAHMRNMSLQYEAELARVLIEETAASSGDPTPRLVASLLGQLARLAFGIAGSAETGWRSYSETVAGINAAFDSMEVGLLKYGVRG